MKLLALLLNVLEGLASLMFFIGGLAMLGWYIAWLDDYFLWRYVAYFIGFFTFPLVLVAVLVEWLWHGWPAEVTRWFILSMSGCTLSALMMAVRKWVSGT